MLTENYPIKYSAMLPLIFTRNVFAVENFTLKNIAQINPALFFFEADLARIYPCFAENINAYFTAHHLNLRAPPLAITGGEICKNGFTVVNKIIDVIAQYQLCRHSIIFAAGGGAFLDVVGMAASLVHRGVRLVRLPTTALAQGDSGVGVKTGINFHGQKNFLGTFATPYCVIADLDFLATLSPALKLDGIAEAFKVAMIKDEKLFAFLEKHAGDLLSDNLSFLEETIQRSAMIHAQHIADNGDPFENGKARPLDFGHWSAHWLEMASDFQVRHGLAVALGIALDTLIAQQLNLLTAAETARIFSALKNCGFTLWHSLLNNVDDLLRGLENFRQHLGGELCLTLPHRLGQKCEINYLPREIITAAVKKLRAQ